jgi:Flp pilus assembly pilin Flp
MLKRLFFEEKGEDLVEYALLTALIAILLVASLTAVKSALVTVFTNIKNALVPPA